MPRRQPRWPSIGLNSRRASTLRAHGRHGGAEALRATSAISSSSCGQELVERRVEQPDRHGQPVHRPEDPLEVACAAWEQLREGASRRSSASSSTPGSSRAPPGCARLEEHVLGAAEPDALGAEAARHPSRRPGCRRWCAPRRRGAVRPAHQLGERAAELGHHGRQARPRITSPVLAVEGDGRRPRRSDRPPMRISRAAAIDVQRRRSPTTQDLPMPRATTAAWDVMPPRAVSTPSAACMPWMSSGEVSIRTRITFSPALARASASSALKTRCADGGAGRGRQPSGDHLARGRRDRASGAAAGRGTPGRPAGPTASSRVISRSRAMSTAIFTAACAVRLPLRVCSSQSGPSGW